MGSKNSSLAKATKKARPSGRPRHNGELDINPRKKILQEAANLFALKGYAGTTMAQIAEEVGIRAPSLYYHFSDKEQILRELATIGLDDAKPVNPSLPVEAEESAGLQLYKFIYDLVLGLRSSPYDLNCLFDPAFPSLKLTDVASRIQTWMNDVRGIVAKGIKDGELQAADTDITASTIRGLISLALRELKRFKTLTPENAAHYTANFALSALLIDRDKLVDFRQMTAVTD